MQFFHKFRTDLFTFNTIFSLFLICLYALNKVDGPISEAIIPLYIVSYNLQYFTKILCCSNYILYYFTPGTMRISVVTHGLKNSRFICQPSTAQDFARVMEWWPQVAVISSTASMRRLFLMSSFGSTQSQP